MGEALRGPGPPVGDASERGRRAARVSSWGDRLRARPSVLGLRATRRATVAITTRNPELVTERSTVVPIELPLGASEAGWLVVALAVLAGGIATWSAAQTWAWAVPVSLLLSGSALTSLVATISLRRCATWTQLLLLASTVVIVLVTVLRAVAVTPAYGTDEAAFDQYAALLLLHGANPYTHSMLPALARYHVEDGARTYLTSGALVGTYSYPALGFVPLAVLLAVGIHTQAAILLDVAGWVATILIAWVMLPGGLRFCAPLLGLGALALGYVSSGLNDPVELPLLLLAVWQWDRFCAPLATRLRRYAAPVALGLAAAVKPTPWFVMPFLVVGVFLEGRSRGLSSLRLTLRYVGAVVGGFLVPNLAFIAWSPSSWLKGVLFPLVQPTVAGGQGLVALVLLHGGGPLPLLDIAGLLVLAAGLFALAAFYGQLRGAVVVLAACALLVPARSFGSYVAYLAPVALVAAVTLRPSAKKPLSDRLRRSVVGGGAVCTIGAAIAVGMALVPPAVSIATVRTATTGSVVDRVVLKVKNRSAGAVSPNYVVSSGGVLGRPWLVVSGPSRIAPNSSATVTVEAPDAATMPSSSKPLLVDALFGESVAATRLVPSGPWHLTLEPEVLPPQPLNRTFALRVQLSGALGGPLRRAGVRVALTQVSYGSEGAYPSEMSIDGRPEGQSPVISRTNGAGIVIFHVRGVQAEGPVFLQAWVYGSNGQLGAYSNEVLVNFASPGG